MWWNVKLGNPKTEANPHVRLYTLLYGSQVSLNKNKGNNYTFSDHYTCLYYTGINGQREYIQSNQKLYAFTWELYARVYLFSDSYFHCIRHVLPLISWSPSCTWSTYNWDHQKNLVERGTTTWVTQVVCGCAWWCSLAATMSAASSPSKEYKNFVM
jgi:hypothetical protein